jgi:ribosome-associated protein
VVRNLTDVLAERRKQDEDDRDLFSRSDARRERKRAELASAELVQILVALPVRQLERLALPEALMGVVLEARRILSPVARARALRLVRRELRGGDADAIRMRLEQVRGPGRFVQPEVLAGCCERLVQGDQNEFDAWVSAGADRQQLRTLVRNLRKASVETRNQATRALTKLLRQIASPSK